MGWDEIFVPWDNASRPMGSHGIRYITKNLTENQEEVLPQSFEENTTDYVPGFLMGWDEIFVLWDNASRPMGSHGIRYITKNLTENQGLFF
ncbi:unnamed protein product [Rotaria socialis]